MVKKNKKICMAFGCLANYRKAIYKMLDQEYDCDWFIDDIDYGVRCFDAKELKSVHSLKVISIGPFYWEKGLLKLLSRDYDIYFLVGATRNLSLFVFCLLKKIFYPKKKIYFWTHGFYGRENWLEKTFWKKPMFMMPDGLFVYGDHAKRIMVNIGFDERRIFTIHNSLDYDRQVALRNELQETDVYRKHFGNDNPVIIFLGRLTKIKRLDILVDALCLLRKRGKIYNLFFVGDGEALSSLEQLVKDAGMSDTTWFYGECYDEKINAELLYNANLCVSPGNIGLTAIHALTFGCPAVSHSKFSLQVPEFEAIKPDKTGLFFEYNNVESLAETIERWFAGHKVDRDDVRLACYKEIDDNWNPYYQMNVIKGNLK